MTKAVQKPQPAPEVVNVINLEVDGVVAELPVEAPVEVPEAVTETVVEATPAAVAEVPVSAPAITKQKFKPSALQLSWMQNTFPAPKGTQGLWKYAEDAIFSGEWLELFDGVMLNAPTVVIDHKQVTTVTRVTSITDEDDVHAVLVGIAIHDYVYQVWVQQIRGGLVISAKVGVVI